MFRHFVPTGVRNKVEPTFLLSSKRFLGEIAAFVKPESTKKRKKTIKNRDSSLFGLIGQK
ncbi:MAG: hypothetical protein HAW65_03400 [Alphaproteobacteria bacterium]|nr:hypothetical protein [Alphaproteobacteria bacterium]